MGSLIDNRHDAPGDDHVVSRKRLNERNKKYIEKAYEDELKRGKMSDLGKKDIVYTVPKDDLREPRVHHGKNGARDIILPGNKDLTVGDRMLKPRGQQGDRGKKGSEENEGEQVDFILSSEEIRKRAFDELGLPNQSKKMETESDETVLKRAGYSSQGPFSRLDFRQSLLRRRTRVRGAEKPIENQIIALLEEAK
ncbi:MAG TPA: DUF444 family protein, partial [Micavibrio sp.]